MEPSHCLICGKGPFKGRGARKHMRRRHKAFLCWDDNLDIDPTGNSGEWTYIYD